MDLKLYPSKDPNFDKLWSMELTGAFVDEVNQLVFKAYQVVSSRVGRYKNDEYNIPWMLLMSCNPAKNWVYKEFYKKQRDGVIERHKKFVQVLAKHNPHIPKEYLKKLAKMQAWALKQRLYYGNWEYDDTPGILFAIDDIASMFKTIIPVNDNDERYLIVDVARHGVDNTTCTYWEGMRGQTLFMEPISDIFLLSERLKKIAGERSVKIHNIIVDEDGVWWWVVDNLWCTWFLNNGAVIENDDGVKPNYQNLKTQCTFVLAEFIKRGKIWLTVNPINGLTQSELEEIIQDELAVIREINLDKDSKRRVIDKKTVKEEIGRSPDRSDNLVMRMLPIVAKDPDLSWAFKKPEEQEQDEWGNRWQ